MVPSDKLHSKGQLASTRVNSCALKSNNRSLSARAIERMQHVAAVVEQLVVVFLELQLSAQAPPRKVEVVANQRPKLRSS